MFLINRHIHRQAHLSKEDFYSLVTPVQAIRANHSFLGLTTYITSEYEMLFIEHLKMAIDKGDFSGLESHPTQRRDNWHIFAIEVPDTIYFWIHNTSSTTAQKQIISWLTFLYYSDPSNHCIFQEQIYQPLLEEVESLYNSFYAGKEPFISLSNPFELYHNACNEYYGSQPPPFLSDLYCSPEIAIAWNIQNQFELPISVFYFSRKDWESVILNKVQNTLIRCESEKNPWIKWKQTFLAVETRKFHGYSLFSTNDVRGYVYLIENSDLGVYKIGFTANEDMESRRRALQTGNSSKLVVRFFFPVASIQAEKALHEFFESKRMSGEWFRLDPEDVNNIVSESWRANNSVF